MTVEAKVKSLCGGCSNAQISENGSIVGCVVRPAKEQVVLLTTYNRDVAEGKEVVPESICFARNKKTLYSFDSKGSPFRLNPVDGIVDPGLRTRLGLGPV